MYEDFEKRFRIPTNLVGKPPQLEAQPPHTVVKQNKNFQFYFPIYLFNCLFVLYLYLYLFLFNYLISLLLFMFIIYLF